MTSKCCKLAIKMAVKEGDNSKERKEYAKSLIEESKEFTNYVIEKCKCEAKKEKKFVCQ